MNPIYSLLLGIAVGFPVAVSAKSPLATWHARNAGDPNATLQRVVFGDGRFVAVGVEGTIVTSTNGIDWAKTVPNTTHNLNALAYGSGRFVAGGDSGTLLWSDNGLDWTNAYVPDYVSITAMAFGEGTNFPNGMFVALAISNSVPLKLTSFSGTDWRVQDAPSDEFSGGARAYLSFGQDRFLAAAEFPWTDPPLFSVTASNWSAAQGVLIGPVVFGNNVFVNPWVFESSATGSIIRVKHSLNGEVWPGKTNFNGQLCRAVTYVDGAFVAVGDFGYAARSFDGTNWLVARTEFDVPLLGLAYGAGIYVAVGGRGFIATSSNGLTWQQRSLGIYTDLVAIAPADNGFITAARAGKVLSSSNGVDWSQIQTATSNVLLSALYGNGMHVFCGAAGTIVSGNTLTNLSVRPGPTTQNLFSVAFGNQTYVAVGGKGSIVTSSDGIDWALQPPQTDKDLTQVAFGNGRFVAVTGFNLQTILVSSNGADWNVITLPFTSARHIAFGNGIFIGSGQGLYRSVDGVSWKLTEGRQGGFPVVYGNGLFLTPGREKNILTSSDGWTWHSIGASTLATAPNSIGYNNGTFVAVGRTGAIYQSDPVTRLVMGGGLGELSIQGALDAVYRVEMTDSPEDTNSWQEAATLYSPPYRWIDTNAPSAAHKFYRAVIVP